LPGWKKDECSGSFPSYHPKTDEDEKEEEKDWDMTLYIYYNYTDTKRRAEPSGPCGVHNIGESRAPLFTGTALFLLAPGS
jgi:hypothetical protein